MPVAIRLSRVGTKHVPFYRVVVVDSRKKRDGKILENIGTYDALQSSIVMFKPERYEDWVKKGAQPSETVKKLYRLFKKKQAAPAEVPTKTKAKARVEKESAAKEQSTPAEKNVSEE